MTKPLLCGHCGSDEVIPRVRVVDRGEGNGTYDLQVEVQLRPEAKIFKQAKRSNLYATMCGRCGFTELFADLPRTLYEAAVQVAGSTTVSEPQELARTKEALADSQIQLHEMEKRLAFLEDLLGRRIAGSQVTDVE